MKITKEVAFAFKSLCFMLINMLLYWDIFKDWVC
jgi:hypothetical protein